MPRLHHSMLISSRPGCYQVFTPLIYAWGGPIMIHNSTLSRRFPQETWTHEHLHCECAVAVSCAIEPGLVSSYSSAIRLYFTFCSFYNFPIDPTPDTLSFYAIYMAHHIKPQLVASYLSGVCSQLEPFFPDVRANRRHWLMTKTLEGCQKNVPVNHLSETANIPF